MNEKQTSSPLSTASRVPENVEQSLLDSSVDSSCPEEKQKIVNNILDEIKLEAVSFESKQQPNLDFLLHSPSRTDAEAAECLLQLGNNNNNTQTTSTLEDLPGSLIAARDLVHLHHQGPNHFLAPSQVKENGEKLTSESSGINLLMNGSAGADIPELNVADLRSLFSDLQGLPADSSDLFPVELSPCKESPLKALLSEPLSPVKVPPVEVLGFSLPRVCSESLDSSVAHVSLSDVFRTFFSKRHWDEFKNILEKNAVRVLPVAMAGSHDAIETITLDQLNDLLLKNQARKEGFVRCTRLGGGADQKVILAQERQPGELSSGIRTRHGDHSDIQYVELDGVTLPAIWDQGAQWVRLADVVRRIIHPHGQNVPTNQLRRLKHSCHTAKVFVGKISGNQKSRLTVYAHSAHSPSLHVIQVGELSRLVDFVRRKKWAQTPRNKRSRDDSASETSSTRPEKRNRRGTSLESSVCSEASSLEEEDDPDFDLSPSSSRPPSVVDLNGPETEWRRVRIALPPAKRRQGRPPKRLSSSTLFRSERQRLRSLWEGACPPVRVPLFLPPPAIVKYPEVSTSLTSKCRNCFVALEKTKELSVVISNPSGTVRGVAGRYCDAFFVCPNAPCIRCTVCRDMLSVRRFLRHGHDQTAHPPSDARIYMNSGVGADRFALWEDFQKKLVKYRMLDLVWWELPPDLSRYYRLRNDRTLPPPSKNLLKLGLQILGTNKIKKPPPPPSQKNSESMIGSRSESPTQTLDRVVEERRREPASEMRTPWTPDIRFSRPMPHTVDNFDRVFRRNAKHLGGFLTDLSTQPIGFNDPEKLRTVSVLYSRRT